jgi:hypothetical protein
MASERYLKGISGAVYLVLEVDRGVEVGDLGVDRLADHLTLASVHDSSHL